MDPVTILQGLELADAAIAALAGSAVVSEALPFMKKYKANSTLQLGINIFKSIFGSKASK